MFIGGIFLIIETCKGIRESEGETVLWLSRQHTFPPATNNSTYSHSVFHFRSSVSVMKLLSKRGKDADPKMSFRKMILNFFAYLFAHSQ